MLTRIVIIGDSQVETALKIIGFGTILNDRFNGCADIVVRKFPGYTTEWIKLLASSVARNLGGAPDYVIVLVGRDDCMRSNLDTRPVTDPDMFHKNLFAIVNKITNEVDVISERLILLSPLPIHQMKFVCHDNNTFVGLTVNSSTLKHYTEKTREVTGRIGGQFVDTSELLGPALDANIGQNGFKLSEDGHLALADKLAELIELTESPFPPYDMVGKNGQDYEKQLDDIAKHCSLVVQQKNNNISAYTYVSALDQYSAFFGKTYRGKV